MHDVEIVKPQEEGLGVKCVEPFQRALIDGVGAALGGVGVWQGLEAFNYTDSVDGVSLEGNPDGLTLAETEDLDAKGRRAQSFQLASIAAGAAIGITGGALLVVGVLRNKRAQDTPTVLVTPTGDRTSAGLSLSGRF